MKRIIFLTLILLLFMPMGWSVKWAQEKPNSQTWDGSLSTAVHMIPLKDEFDQVIIPSTSYALPYSTRYTCAPCHDYATIQQGLHFNTSSPAASQRLGEPWVWVDPHTGTVLPLSFQDLPGVWHPEDLSLSAWDLTLLFGRHMTGGLASKSPPNPESRWEVSGELEINCMGCHNASRMQSHSEWAKQILRQNFRWAGTAASGLGEVGGMASRLPNTWDIIDGPNPDDTEWAVVPQVQYKRHIFDSKHRVFFDIANPIPDERCLTCHSVSPRRASRIQTLQDVHSSAGIGCVDCHRHDITHTMSRGYDRESADTADPSRAKFSCRGCHLGENFKDGTGGDLGAPYPQHKGIPAVHFERLTCTVCHSGPLPQKGYTQVQSSRANRLGIYGIAQWSMEYPHIIEPVYVRDKQGHIAPHRLLWPAFWVQLNEDKVIPLKPDDVLSAAREFLEVEEDIARILAQLTLVPDLPGQPVIVLSEKIFKPNLDGQLDVYPASTMAMPSDGLWMMETETGLLPLIPLFDPDAEEPDVDAETKIQLVLETLLALSEKPGQPVVIQKKSLFQIKDGFLDMVESSQPVQAIPLILWQVGDTFVPLISEFQKRTILALADTKQTLTEEQVQMVLRALAVKGGEFGYICNGKLFRLDADEELRASDHSAANPVTWPLGHQVRPAQQSLGIKGCTQCHTEGSAFFFNPVLGDGPLLTQHQGKRSAASFMELNTPYQRLFGLSFRVRPLFKMVLWVTGIFIGAVLLLMFVLIVGRYTGLIDKRGQS